MAANRRAAFEKNIKRLVDDCPDDHIDQMDRPTVDDNLDKLRRNFDKFETEHLGLIGDAKTVVETQAHDDKYTEVDEIATTLRRKLAKRDLDLKKEEEAARQPQQANAAAPQQVEVNIKNPNVFGNIDDTWGAFYGDWNKWPDFRERFRANVHENDALTPVQKCQLLIKACKNAAKSTIGVDIAATEANYNRAWEQLHRVYQDDYLAIQQTVSKLLTFRDINMASYHDLRAMSDMIHSVEGELSNFFDVKHWHPMIMFTCLLRLDSETYEKWEVERQSMLTKKDDRQNNDVQMDQPNDQQQRQNQNDDNVEGPILPTLDQFKGFLERHSRILMHKHGQVRDSSMDRNQQRSRDPSQNRQKSGGAVPKQKPNQQENGSRQGQNSNQKRPMQKLALCRLCNNDHGLFSCQIFRDMPFVERVEMVNKHNLCKVCFHVHDQGSCHINQHPCKKCNGQQTHNTLICPSREAEKRTTMLSVVGNNPNPITFNKPGQKRSHAEQGHTE